MLVDDALHGGTFFGTEAGVVGKVEAQARGIDDAAGLLDVLTEYVLQGSLE